MPDINALISKPSTDADIATATAAAATLTIPAPTSANASIYITGVTYSWGASPSLAASATIKEDTSGANVTVFQFEVPQAVAAPVSENWGIRPLQIAPGKNAAISLPNLGTGVKGTVAVRWFVAAA